MRVGVWAVSLVVVAATVGWLLLRSHDGDGGEGAMAPPLRASPDPGGSPEPGASAGVAIAEAGTPGAAALESAGLLSDLEGEGGRAASREVAGSDAARRPVGARRAPALEPGPEPGRFDARALEEAGYRPHEVEEIRRRWEQAEAEVRAAGEQMEADAPGFTGQDPRREQHEFDSAMREMLDDDDYDAGRFATGLDNRVEIRSIPEGSNAGALGLQEGDRLIAYDGTPIYTSDEYFEHRRQDRALGPREVVLTIEREGRTYQIVVPGGEVLASFQDVRVQPTP